MGFWGFGVLGFWGRIEYELGEWIIEQDSTPDPKQVFEWFKENYQVPNKK